MLFTSSGLTILRQVNIIKWDEGMLNSEKVKEWNTAAKILSNTENDYHSKNNHKVTKITTSMAKYWMKVTNISGYKVCTKLFSSIPANS